MPPKNHGFCAKYGDALNSFRFYFLTQLLGLWQSKIKQAYDIKDTLQAIFFWAVGPENNKVLAAVSIDMQLSRISFRAFIAFGL